MADSFSANATVDESMAVSLDLSEVDLSKVPSLKGTALEAVIKEISEEDDLPSRSRHHSHHSYRTHGTAAW